MLLAERESQTRHLSKLLESSRQGRGSVAVVVGAVGAGKSSLLHAFAEQIEPSGGSVLTATCSEWDRNRPWGVVEQLLGNIRPENGKRTAIARLLQAGMATANWSDSDPDVDRHVSAQIMPWLLTAEQSSHNGPTVIVVDDVHHADQPSLQFLSQFARKIAFGSGMLVLSVPYGHGPDPDFMRLPHYSRVWLPLLAETGIAAVIGQGADRQLTRTLHELSGGNPLLLHALMADRAATPDSDSSPTAVSGGTEFVRALSTCLNRSGDATLEVARGLAVLDTHHTPDLVAELLGIDAAHVPLALRALNNAGLFVGEKFRHKSVRSAVLDSLGVSERRRLYLDAATLLHRAGAGVSAVAERLVQAGEATSPWMIDVLYHAAEQALDNDRVDFALCSLRLIRASTPPGASRSRITVLQMMAESRSDAVAAARHLPEAMAGLNDGQLAGRELVATAQFLFRHGHGDKAADMLGKIQGVQQATLRDWLVVTRPEQVRSDDETTLQIRTLGTVLTQNDEAIGHAEKVLESSRLTDVTVECKASAVLTLIYTGQLDKASTWCASLLEEAMNRRASAWQAVFTAIDAELALRRGALPRAHRAANVALTLMPAAGWGVSVGMPLSGLLLATTAMSMMDDALDSLSRPVPEAMFQTRFGVQYLYARGRHFLATNRLHAALDDFMKCGSLLTAWDMDVPAMVPWRNAAAMAHYAMGDHARTHELVTEQLQVRGGDDSRTKGVALRLLAATGEPRRRLALLQESSELLKSSGDQLEFALTLGELSQEQRAVGEPTRARVTARFATKVAEACGAKPFLAAVDDGYAPRSHDDTNGFDVLSDAERRVAILAARGRTNQEIAQRLFITVSTVEQHLTKVYRKLSVSGRADLPIDLVS